MVDKAGEEYSKVCEMCSSVDFCSSTGDVAQEMLAQCLSTGSGEFT